MGRGVVSRMSAAGASGYPGNQQLLMDPDNIDNPTTGTETAGAYLYKWDHDNVGDEWHKEMNLPFQLDWEAGETTSYISLAPYSTGARLQCAWMPISPTWASEVITWLGLTQSGTTGNYDKYPMVVGNIAECRCTVDGHNYDFTTFGFAWICLWTANNSLYAAIYVDMNSTVDDSTLETKLAAANPNFWSSDGFQISIKLTKP